MSWDSWREGIRKAWWTVWLPLHTERALVRKVIHQPTPLAAWALERIRSPSALQAIIADDDCGYIRTEAARRADDATLVEGLRRSEVFPSLDAEAICRITDGPLLARLVRELGISSLDDRSIVAHLARHLGEQDKVFLIRRRERYGESTEGLTRGLRDANVELLVDSLREESSIAAVLDGVRADLAGRMVARIAALAVLEEIARQTSRDGILLAVVERLRALGWTGKLSPKMAIAVNDYSDITIFGDRPEVWLTKAAPHSHAAQDALRTLGWKDKMTRSPGRCDFCEDGVPTGRCTDNRYFCRECDGHGRNMLEEHWLERDGQSILLSGRTSS